MSNCYVEPRKTDRGSIDLAADIVRHLRTRQYLGKTVIVCEHPAIFLASTHKQWLKLSRTIQSQRASTSNADKILKYTRTITHMQHMRFTAKTPVEAPESDVYFLCREQLVAPAKCLNVYLAAGVDRQTIATLLQQVAADALIVDYVRQTAWDKLGVQPKRVLEEHVEHAWQAAQEFLREQDIEPRHLFAEPLNDVEGLDNALDTLLGVAHRFLRVADDFNHALELARPLRLGKVTRQQYDTFALLAHRVQALSTASFSQRFLEMYNEDDSFFLYDRGTELRRASSGIESLAEAIARHLAAGRRNLAQALQLSV